jgi:predicted DCC family thiol-disulfide oxidoreductase YuxK
MTPTPRAGYILYDGECSFCIRWCKLWRPVLESNGFTLEMLQAPWVASTLGIPLEELLHDVRLLTPEGRLISGADVYLYVARRIWWAQPFAYWFGLPGFKTLLELSYRSVADNRHCLAGTCKLPPPPPSDSSASTSTRP